MTSENNSNGKITLILGGARSGKSRLAEKLAHKRAAGPAGVLYVATLEPSDDNEMRERITRHRADRPASWPTLEAPYELAESVQERWQSGQLVLLDCLTVWTSNQLLRAEGQSASAPVYEEVLDNSALLANLSVLEPDREEDITSDVQAEFHARPRRPVVTTTQPDYAMLETHLTAELERLVSFLRRQDAGLVVVSNEVGMGLVPPYPLGRAYRDLLGRLNQRLAALADEVFIVIAGIPVELKRLQADS